MPAVLALPLALGVLIAPQAQAGLGPLKIISTQGEALLAELALDLGAIPDSALVRLAAASDYPSLQAYTPNAAGLRLELHPTAGGQPRVRIFGPSLAGTDRLHFAVEFVWPGGRWVREYRLYGYNIPSLRSSLPEGRGAQSLRPLPWAETSLPKRRPFAYRVATGDTAFALARRFYPRLSPDKAIRLLLAANPLAFVAADANRLLAGASLALPAAPSKVRRVADAPRPALLAPTTVKEVVKTPAGPDAEAKAKAERSILQLQQAQARLAELEREVARQERAQLAPPTVGMDDTLLDEELARWIAGGAGGVAVMSLLAWQLLRRRRAAREKAGEAISLAMSVPAPDPIVHPVPEGATTASVLIAAQPYVDESVALLQIDHQAMGGPPVDSAELALSRLFAEMGDHEAAERAAQDSRAPF